MTVRLTELRPLRIPGIVLKMWWAWEFKARDCWFGVYPRPYVEMGRHRLALWICIVPMFPLFVDIDLDTESDDDDD